MMRFECPKCGGSHFGTSTPFSDPIVRSCHDEFGRGCRWRGEELECMVIDERAALEAIHEIAARKVSAPPHSRDDHDAELCEWCRVYKLSKTA